jgi:hypothetical protein
MCDPVTVGVALAVSLNAAIAGAGISAYSAIQQGRFQKGMAKYQAKLSRNRAARAVQAGEFEAAANAQKRRQIAAAGQASFAQNGVLLDGAPTSAPNLWDQDQAAAAAFEAANIRDSARAVAWGHSTQATMDTLQGSMARKSATYSAWGSALSGVSSVAGTASAFRK